ncbi:MAG: lamin tail domain-containing protein [Candidatus Eisenbacteria bacterium]|uniref:Lamin tail domain-containing protein n=1 Tax=Eiseniibacteriota bacterium TaxID=2212470 RepID=A0A948RVI9_UNCEI|nr:lamin tail domain-containing protein [Candidatus Eisenbacteria bacterium]MBU1947268.1 lamin tail domain-containing protein [Candidatus Eisenbacteria bacterium]MBU2691805.1 lamin tail domain-containing protein [Candidatus Eisenbacteria bacterium]
MQRRDWGIAGWVGWRLLMLGFICLGLSGGWIAVCSATSEITECCGNLAGPESTAVCSIDGESRVVINEIFYDPQGSDTGKEYVELFNAGLSSIVLDDIILESGNGARPESWSVEWAAPSNLVLDPGAFLWIGGVPEGYSGSPDFETTLHLQNGPDAARVRRGDEVIDLVGWGVLEYPVYYEGLPAPDLPSGEALGRMPDGNDTGDNSRDFQALSSPSPGKPNKSPQTLFLESPHADPRVASPDEPIGWSARLVHSGLDPVVLSPAVITWDGRPLHPPLPEAIYCDSPVSFNWEEKAPSQPGFYQREIMFCLNSDTLLARTGFYVGTGPVAIVEIQYDPLDGEKEWVEILVREEIYSLNGWGLEDAGGRRILIDDSRPIFRDDRFILSEDPVALVAARPDFDFSKILALSGTWPSLNNTIQEEIGVADILVLSKASGEISDVASYTPPPGAGDGISLERRSVERPSHPIADWIPSPHGPTPGSPGFLEQQSLYQGKLLITPTVLTRGESPGCLILPPATPEGRTWSAEVFDISGRRVRTLGLQERKAGEPAFWWNGEGESGRGVAPGLYVVCVKSWTEGKGSQQWSASLGVTP